MTTTWLKALKEQKLEVESARDAMKVKGWLDSGNYALNWAISGRFGRGYPLGHTCEVFGDQGTGKSFLAARALAMAQRAGGVALLDDTEGAYNAEHSQRLGIDIEKLGVSHSYTVNDHLKLAQGFLKAYAEMDTKKPGVIVCDSLAQLTTEHEVESQLDRRDMSKAAELKAVYRLIGGKLIHLPVMHLATNHTIANIGNPFQARGTPGGGGPRFSATVRLDLRAISKIKSGDDYAGVICTVFVDKNRIAPPWKRVQLAIPFDRPIAPWSGLIPVLVGLDVLQENGNFLMRGKTKVGRAFSSKEKFLDQDAAGEKLLRDDPQLLATVDQLLDEGKIGTQMLMPESEANGKE